MLNATRNMRTTLGIRPKSIVCVSTFWVWSLPCYFHKEIMLFCAEDPNQKPFYGISSEVLNCTHQLQDGVICWLQCLMHFLRFEVVSAFVSGTRKKRICLIRQNWGVICEHAKRSHKSGR